MDEDAVTARIVSPTQQTVYRVPYPVFTDPEIYRLEQQKIFRGDHWSFVGLEAEIPNPGDFKSTFVGDTPVVVTRGKDEAVHVVENRCAHRGATVAGPCAVTQPISNAFITNGVERRAKRALLYSAG
jgi:anthranilate 1,2-dioxygenase large subunit